MQKTYTVRYPTTWSLPAPGASERKPAGYAEVPFTITCLPMLDRFFAADDWHTGQYYAAFRVGTPMAHASDYKPSMLVLGYTFDGVVISSFDLFPKREGNTVECGECRAQIHRGWELQYDEPLALCPHHIRPLYDDYLWEVARNALWLKGVLPRSLNTREVDE